jgi:hypothetical protein
MPADLGAFEGQHTEDADASHDAWRWQFADGQILFSTDASISLDGSTPIEYCGSCEQDMKEDRGIDPGTHIFVRLLNN